MRFSGGEIGRITGGRLLAPGPEGPVGTDTRQIAPGSWFVALRGERFDGHDCLADAARLGCAGVVVSREPPEGWAAGAVLVDDTLRALQDLGHAVRRRFSGPVVGLTGSVGKTTTRALTSLALSAHGRVHETGGNLNNHVGVPLTLLAAPDDADFLVIEMGMSGFGEIHRLAEIAEPTVRLITNVAPAHLEGVGDLSGVARAKGELFASARPGDVLCVNQDDARVAALPRPTGVRIVRFGSRADCDVHWLGARLDPVTLVTRYRLCVAGLELSGVLPVPAPYVAWNAAAAAAVLVALELPLQDFTAALAGYQPVGMRMRVEDGPGGIRVLNDAYNANPASMVAAIGALASLGGVRRVALLGDMLELGPGEVDLHEQVLVEALSAGLDLLAVCGPRMREAAERLGSSAGLLVAADPVGLAELAGPLLRNGDVVLLKGSRGMAMERVLLALGGG
jgi:UDP-N-acetylmuramoyl-tripeptide--D-alanyl-D-alanine ligase